MRSRPRALAMVAIQAKTWMPDGIATAMLAAEKKLPETWIHEPPAHWSIGSLGGLHGRKLALIGIGGIGQAVAVRALPHLKRALESHSSLVIDGLYGFGEYKLLRETLGASMVVVAVVSPRHLRYQRLHQRKDRPFSLAEAEARDYREIETLEKGGPIAIADYTLLNDRSPEALLRQLGDLCAQLDFHP